MIFFLIFLNHLLQKNWPRGRSDRGRFCHRQLRELYEDDFRKPGIYGSGRVWANAWDVFRRATSRGGRGRRAAVDMVVCFGRGGFLLFLVFSTFFFERTRPTASMKPPCLIYISTSRGKADGAKRPRQFFSFRAKSLFIPGCVQGPNT